MAPKRPLVLQRRSPKVTVNTESFVSNGAINATKALNRSFWAWPNRKSVLQAEECINVCLEAELVTLQAGLVYFNRLSLSEHAAAGAGNVPLIQMNHRPCKACLPQSYHMT